MNNSSQIKVAQIGIGPLGQKVVRYIYKRKWIRIVAAVDKARNKIGKDLGEICNIGKKIGIKVEEDISIKKERPD
jgi:4-hydroxy-tetrahydrodipicolinate reductase